MATHLESGERLTSVRCYGRPCKIAVVSQFLSSPRQRGPRTSWQDWIPAAACPRGSGGGDDEFHQTETLPRLPQPASGKWGTC